MPDNENRHVFTYQTRVSVTPEQDKRLQEYAVLFGRVERTLYREMQKGGDAKRLKSEYLVRFGITARQFNAVRIQLQGKIEAIRKLLPVQIEDLRTKIGKAKKVVGRLSKHLPGSSQLHQKRRRLARLEHRLRQREAERQADHVRLCFGSKKLFHAQFHLAENGFQSHDEWRQAWREARSNQFFVLGSKDETAGCQGCVATRDQDGSYCLRVRLPNQAMGKHLVLAGVRFAYGQQQFEESLAGRRALSYRFLRDSKGWRVFVSSEAMPVKRITDRRWGAIGLDLNPHQLVLAELDHCGNFQGGEHIACVTYGKRREQAKAVVGDAVKQVMAVAVRSRKPLVIERLDFRKKKAALENAGSGRARMLSSFAYRQAIQSLRPCHSAPTCMESGKTCMVVLVEGLATDPSGASSACTVASHIGGKHTGVWVCPDVVCYLNIAWCDPARESFPTAVRETWWHKMPYFRNGDGMPSRPIPIPLSLFSMANPCPLNLAVHRPHLLH